MYRTRLHFIRLIRLAAVFPVVLVSGARQIGEPRWIADDVFAIPWNLLDLNVHAPSPNLGRER